MRCIGGRLSSLGDDFFGPTITGAHSPDERCNIADVKMVWEYLVEVLAIIPEKQ